MALLNELHRRRSSEYVGPAAEWLIHLGRRDPDALCASFEACLADGITGFSLEAIGGPLLDEVASDPRISGYLRRFRMMPNDRKRVMDA